MTTALAMPARSAPAASTAPAPTGSRSYRPVAELEREHPLYQERKQAWALTKLLYQGGYRIRAFPKLVLERKAKELDEVYAARCRRLTYQNILQSALDYYRAAIFEKQPEYDVKTRTATGQAVQLEMRPDQKVYYEAFQKNCDRRQTSLTDFFGDLMVDALLYQSAWFLIDLPQVVQPPQSLADQIAAGLLDVYLVRHEPDAVTNWGEDEFQQLLWAVVYSHDVQQQWDDKALTVDRWYYYDRQRFQIYERTYREGMEMPVDARLVAEGLHSLADRQVVPLLRFHLPEGLWLANRVIPQIHEHLNQDNAYGYALFNSNLAMPVIIGDFEETPTLTAGGYLKLPLNCQIAWTEPPGGAFERSEARIASLREEIYRQVYLMYQARSAADSPAVQSGFAKQLDMAPAGHVQSYLGDRVRKAIQQALDLIAHVRGDGLEWDVRGFDFEEDQTDLEIARAQQFDGIQVQSPTAQRENHKRVIKMRFRDANPTLIQTMCDEVDANPTPMERAEIQQEEQRQMQAAQFDAAMEEAAAKSKEAKGA